MTINEALWQQKIDEAARRGSRETKARQRQEPSCPDDGDARAKRQRGNGHDAGRFKWETADTTKGPVLNSLWLVKGVLPRHGTGALAE